MFYYFFIFEINNKIHNYYYCGNVNDVDFFCNENGYKNKKHFKYIEDEIKLSEFKYKYVYLDNYKYNGGSYSFLYCEHKFGYLNLFENSCLSYYIIEAEHE